MENNQPLDELNRTSDGAADAAAEAPAPTPAPDDAPDDAQAEELESLRDTFQRELDLAREAAQEPEIQALDEEEEEGDEEDEEEDDDLPFPADDDAPAKKKKKSRWWIAIPVTVAVLLLLFLGSYFVLSFAMPSFNEFISSYSEAKFSAKTDEDKLDAYTAALASCDEGSVLSFLRQDLLENIVVLTNKTQSYSAAYSYMQANMTEEMIAAPSTKAFKSFLEIGDKIEDVANRAYDAVKEAIGSETTADGFKAEAVMKQLDVPELIRENVSGALTTLAGAVAAENAAADREGLQNAYRAYLQAAQAFQTLGANAASLYEQIALKLYQSGFAYEAKMVMENYLPTETDKQSEALKAVSADLEAIAAAAPDVYGLAVDAFEAGSYGEKDIEAAIDADLSDNAKKSVALIANTVAEALAAKEEKNLTKAAGFFSSAASAMEALSLEALPVYGEAFSVYCVLPDLQSAKTVADTYLTDSDALDSELRRKVERFNELYEAMNAANGVFSPFYSNYYYSGTEMNKEEIFTALDSLLTDGASDKQKAMVNYYKFVAATLTEIADEDYALLETAAELLSDYPMICLPQLVSSYMQRQMYAEANDAAQQILAINVADDYANSVAAFYLRTQKDLDGALAAAERGMELSAAKNYCACEAAVDCMLQEDYAKALEYVAASYANAPTLDNVSYLKILNKVYASPSKEEKEQLEGLMTEIDALLEQNGVELPEAAAAILAGEKTVEEVFLTAPYGL